MTKQTNLFSFHGVKLKYSTKVSLFLQTMGEVGSANEKKNMEECRLDQ